jgi:Animal haem peroxidase
MPQHHSTPPRGLEFTPRSILIAGRFGRMFRNLPGLEPADSDLKRLAEAMLEAPEADEDGEQPPQPPPYPGGDGGEQEPDFDNPDIPSGYTYVGQFIDHDITFDPVSSLQRQNDPDGLNDFRTPRFDLDSVYGSGPNNDPFLYDQDSRGTKLLLGQNEHGDGDLPRNSQGRALLGDPRNDENVIVSQLHFLFLRFHNKVVDLLASEGLSRDEIFEEAQRRVRWHYQWIVAHDFLRRVAGLEVIDNILVDRPYVAGAGTNASRKEIDLCFYHWQDQPFMPVEFSAAAYRFGHSMIRPDYRINTTITQEIPIFVGAPHPAPTADLRGFRPLPQDWEIDWSFFFEIGEGSHLQPARLIDAKLAHPLVKLPGLQPAALALRNLRRGKRLALPSGERVAMTMGLVPLAEAELEITSIAEEFRGHTPLWFYVLKEAEVRAGGRRLGPVGGRIVAEVLLGLLKGDALSYINVEPNWTPTLPAADADDFTMPDLITFVNS